MGEELIELVINISHGRDHESVDRLTYRIQNATQQARLLHVDRGVSADRTVYTIVGSAKGIHDILLCIYQFANEYLKLEAYAGNHPTTGVVDVVPFIPMKGIGHHELKEIVKSWAMEIADKYGLPIFYYGPMSQSPHKESLSQIRKGGPAELSQRIEKGSIIVDVGPQELNPVLGASCWTVRPYMLAYNINLKTDDLEMAKSIARTIRNDRKANEKFHSLKVLAWYVEEYGCCQLSCNIYNSHQLTMTELYQYVEKRFPEVVLGGSELIGMTPLGAIDRFADRQNVHEYIKRLGLSFNGHFNPSEKILEFALDLEENLALS